MALIRWLLLPILSVLRERLCLVSSRHEAAVQLALAELRGRIRMEREGEVVIEGRCSVRRLRSSVNPPASVPSVEAAGTLLW